MSKFVLCSQFSSSHCRQGIAANVFAVAAGAGHQNTKKTNSSAGPCGNRVL